MRDQTTMEPAAPPAAALLAAAVRLHQQGDLPAAERTYRAVLEQNPREADALHLLGVLHMQRGSLGESLDALLEASALNPLNPWFQKSLGDIFIALHTPARAIPALEKALALKPDFADALVNLGIALAAERRFEEAAARFTRALEISPDRVTALVGLAGALKETGQLDAAERTFTLTLRVDPRNADAYAGLGDIFITRHEWKKALATLQTAVTLNPGVAPVLNNLGNACRELGDPARALSLYKEALAIAPSEAAIHFNLGNVLIDTGDIPSALTAYTRAAALKPEYAEAHANKALLQLLLGDYDQGWAEYEWRFRLKDPTQLIDRRTFDCPLWDGAPFPGKTLFLRSEQGAGDMIQFCRYAPLVKERGGTVILECPPRLCRLLRGVPGVDRIVPRLPQRAADFDYYIPLLSVPRFFTRTLDDIPAPVPYLRPEPELVAAVKPLVPGAPLKVGICWQGNKSYKGDAQRSIPLQALLPLLELHGARFFSLQKGEGSEQLQQLPASLMPVNLAAQLDNGPDAFVETAAAMHHLDLIISSDTSIAHLAGALGRPAWLLLPQPPEWRWLLDRPDTPWYPAMRLFRQRSPGDWNSAVAAARCALEAVLARGGRP